VVERVAVGRTLEAAPDISVEGDVTIIPAVREELVAERRLVLAEEVRMRRIRTTERHRETVDLLEQVAEDTRLGPEDAALQAEICIPKPASVQSKHPGVEPLTDETIAVIYDNTAHVDTAIADLKAAGIPEGAITRHADRASTSTTSAVAPMHEKGFWSRLFGGEPDHDTTVYDRSMAAGSTILSVRTPAVHVAKVMEILERHDPVDIDERAMSYGLIETTSTRQPVAMPTPDTAAESGPVSDAEETVQLAEESLAVGKRVMNRGGTRIRRFVVETPVEQSVSLRDEKVMLERRPVSDDRPVTDSFADKTIEMTESSEQAVVSKTARVYEEVGLRKEATDRVETIHDTVRKDEVEVEQIPSTTTSTGTTRSDQGSKI
jgi:uncharacterized protein (TIGR02271 family)